MTASSRDIDRHRLPHSVFHEFCSGALRRESMELLLAGQRSRRLLLLRSLMEFSATGTGWLAEAEQAWQLLEEAERRNPAAVNEVLMYPAVGVWVGRALRQARMAAEDAFGAAEFGYLQLVAAAAAIKADLPCWIRVPVAQGVIVLPTLGRIRLSTSFPVAAAELHNTPGGVRVQAMGGRLSVSFPEPIAETDFAPMKRHTTSARETELAVWIDDIDPYREFSRPQPPDELDHADAAEWCKLLDEAWEILTHWYPENARELSACVTAIAPIDPGSGTVGASSAAAFGGVALSAKQSATDLAEVLVHELQHSKLNALLNLVDLADNGAAGHFYAPWRDDPRPVEGMLHGIYAFVSVVEFWRVQRDVLRGAEAGYADFWFAYRRHQVRQAVNGLRSAVELTELGHELVRAVQRRLERCERETVPGEVPETVARLADDHYGAWRLRWIRPAKATVDALAAAWLDGCPAIAPVTRVASVLPGARSRMAKTRGHLLKLKALDPDRFAGLIRHPAGLDGSTPIADAAYCAGDYEKATATYLNRVHADPDDGHAWVGLGLSMRAQGDHATATSLLTAPELIVAVHRRVRMLGGAPPSALSFAEWFGPETTTGPDRVR